MFDKFKEIVSHYAAFEVQLETTQNSGGSPPIMEPLLSQEVLSPEYFEGKEFSTLFRRLQKDPRRRVKIYVDGSLSPRSEHTFVTTPIKPEETIDEWLARTFQEHRYGVIVNGTEQWSDLIGRWASRLFAPIVERQEKHTVVLETFLFVGNYGFTPFGIHIDDPYSSIVHFNLGPGEKTMTLFTREEFHALNGPGDRSFAIADLVPQGRSFVIHPGYGFVLPPEYFHIANTPDFSIDISVTVSKVPPPRLTEFVLNRGINAKWMKGDLDTVLQRAPVYGWNSGALTEWISRNAEEQEMASLSNRHLRNPYGALEKIAPVSNTRLCLDPDFPIKIVRRHDEILVFARGNRIKLAPTALSECLLSTIIKPEGFTPADVHQAINAEISLDAVCAILSRFVNAGGLIAC